MNPKDCLNGDWRRYYHRGFMLHASLGPVEVIVEEHPSEKRYRFKARTSISASFRVTKSADLRPFYPESGCYNHCNEAIFVQRRARQSIQRTSTCAHYNVSWSSGGRRIMDSATMWTILRPAPYPNFTHAAQTIIDSQSTSVAISPELIIQGSDRTGVYTLMYQDQVAGIVENGVYIPDWEDSPVVKLARLRLNGMDLPCL